MEIKIKETERIDDLEYKGYKIIQDKEGFCYGMDSVLLSDFAKEIKKDSKVVDLGTGNGILGILLCAKTQLSKMIGVEIQQEAVELANKNIMLNKLESRFEIIKGNIKESNVFLSKESFDVVVSNPPYKKKNSGLYNENKKKMIARHEITASLEDFIKAASEALKDRGQFYLVHRPERLVDILTYLRKYHLEPKQMQLVYPKAEENANLVLIKAIKNARAELTLKNPLIIYDENGTYTKEVRRIYHKEEEEK